MKKCPGHNVIRRLLPQCYVYHDAVTLEIMCRNESFKLTTLRAESFVPGRQCIYVLRYPTTSRKLFQLDRKGDLGTGVTGRGDMHDIIDQAHSTERGYVSSIRRLLLANG